jgi:predicted enzyme related to lactoylglutathione lyase
LLIESVGALLLISDDAERLAAFYRNALGLPVEDEVHDGVPLHYGCELGSLHFAIHPSDGWPGQRATQAQSPVIVFYTADVEAVYRRLTDNGVAATPPFDHGFAIMTAFRDPDGHNVQVMQPAE